MAWSSNIDKAELGSTGGGNPLLVGKFTYKIAAVVQAVNKKDQSGKEQQVIIDFERSGKIHKVWFSPEHSNTVVAEIAIDQLGKISKAAGMKGVLKPERLKLMIGKFVELDAYENNKGGKTHINIGGIDVAKAELEEADDEEEEEDEVEADEDESEEEEAPVKAKKKQPWG